MNRGRVLAAIVIAAVGLFLTPLRDLLPPLIGPDGIEALLQLTGPAVSPADTASRLPLHPLRCPYAKSSSLLRSMTKMSSAPLTGSGSPNIPPCCIALICASDPMCAAGPSRRIRPR